MIACGVRRVPADIFSSRLKIVCGNVMVLLMLDPPMRFDVLDVYAKEPESGREEPLSKLRGIKLKSGQIIRPNLARSRAASLCVLEIFRVLSNIKNSLYYAP